jgi:gluconate 5-dehydrogenase
MTKSFTENPPFDTWLKSRTPMGRWGDPTELIGTLIFLASRASSFLSGQILYVDGGPWRPFKSHFSVI